MTPQDWKKTRALLESVAEMPASEREAFLTAADADEAILAETRRLLSFEHEASLAFPIETWQGRAVRTAAEPDLAGLAAGPYRLQRELGRGGMGAVYLAERADGTYQQKVAVKILQQNIHSDALASRFRQERQILAQLHHPGIARLLDGGVLPDERPYLVLEYVDGLPIDRFCAEQKLSLEAKLRLFLRVAEAVQSAHQQLVLHLDLKPANILVTPEGDPRLLDFGLARILSDTDAGAEATLRLLTPRYASPEQALGAPLTVASDVFSLATLLYKLLTGTLPYPLEDASPLAAVRILNDTAPTVPSRLQPALRGELDTILMQALRKEPERRYPTVAAFRDDVQRFLESRPVLAHADSFRYRAGKFVRRHRLPVAAVAATLLVVLASAVAVVRSAAMARRERAAAERRLQDIEDLARFYVVDLFSALNNIPGTLPVRKQMAAQAVTYLESMTGERDGDPKFSLDLANGLFEMAKIEGFPNQPSLGDLRGAQNVLSLARQMVELHARQVPGDPANHAREGLLLASEANIANSLGDVDGAVALEQRAWDEVQPVLRGGKSKRWMQISTYCFFDAVFLARDDQFNLLDPERALAWISRGEDLLLELGREKPEFAGQWLYRTQLTQVRFTKAEMLGKLGRDAEARSLFEQAMREADAEPARDTIEISKHRRDVHRLYAAFLLERGELRHAAAVSEALRPAEQARRDAGPGVFDEVEYGVETAWWATLSAHLGHRADADRWLDRSLRTTRALLQGTPEDMTLLGQHAINLVNFAELPGVEPGRARALYGEVIPLVNAYAEAHPAVLGARLLEARAHLGLARLAQANGDREEQKEEAARALVLLQALAAQRPHAPELARLLQATETLGG